MLTADLGLLDDGIGGDAVTDLFPIIQGLLSGTDATVTDGALDAGLPLLGRQLASHTSGQFANAIEDAWSTGGDQTFDFRTATVQEARAEIANRFSTLGATGSNVQASGSLGANLVQFTIPLTQTLTNQRFDLSISEKPAVEILLGHAGQVITDVTWTFDLVVGVTDTEFFIDVSNSSDITNGTDEIQVNIAGRIAQNLVGYGTLGIFGSLYNQDASSASTFNYTYRIDLVPSTADSSLSSAQWAAQLGQSTTITGSAIAHLDAKFSAVPDFGGLVTGVDAAIDMDFETDVTLQWAAVNITDTTDFTINGELTYDNTRIDLLKFVTEFITPTTGLVQDALQPVSTIVDIFKDPIPGISDLFEALKLGRGPSLTDLITLAITLSGNQNLLGKFLILDGLLLEPLDALLDLPTFEPGDFTSSFQAGGSSASIGTSKFGFATSDLLNRGDATGRRFERLDKNADNEVLRRSLDAFRNPRGKKVAYERLFYGGAGFAFPFLDDPGLLFDMMLGDSSVEFASFSSTLGLDFFFEVPFSFPFPGIQKILRKIGIDAGFGLEIIFGIATNIKYGYDAVGISTLTNQLDFTNTTFLALSVADNINALENGHFFDDHNTTGNSDGVPTAGLGPAAFTGDLDGTLSSDFRRTDRDNPELAFSVSVKPFARVGLDLNIFSFRALVSAGLVGTLIFDMNDLPNGTVEFLLSDGTSVPRPSTPFAYDGVVRGLELAAIRDNSSNLTVFERISTAGGFLNVGGSIVFEGGVRVEVTAFRFLRASWSFQFIQVTLASGQFPNNDASLIDNIVVEPPNLGTVQNGTLDLFAGSTASQRQFTTGARDAASDNAAFEEFKIVSLGPTDPNNPALGETIVVNFVGRQSANGDVIGRGQQRFENVRSIRGNGGTEEDDFFIDSTVGVPVTISGGSGNDVLVHQGQAPAVLRGDEDDDTITGGGAADTLVGGAGADLITGGLGSDSIQGGTSNDTITGDGGADIIDGGQNDDTIIWRVADGDDTITGGGGLDEIIAEGATTVIGGGAILSPNSPTIVEEADDITVTKNGQSLTIASPGEIVSTTGIENISLQLGTGGDRVTVNQLSANGGNHTLNIEMTEGTTIFNGLVSGSLASPTSEIDHITVRAVSDNDQGMGSGGVVEVVSNIVVGGATTMTTRLINTDKTRDSLRINAGGANDTVTVEHGALLPTDLIALTVDGGADDDTITVEDGDATLNGGGGTLDMIIVGYGNHTISSAGPTNITVKDFGRGTGAPVVSVSQAPNNRGSVRIVRDGITDQIDIDVASGNLLVDTSLSAVGSNATILSTFADASTLTGGNAVDTFLVRTATAPVTLNGGGGNDLLTVETNDAAVVVNGGQSTDTITIGAGLLSGIAAAITVSGNAGEDTIVFDAQNDPTARPTITVGTTQVTNIGTMVDPTFSGIEVLNLKLGLAPNTVLVPALDRRLVVDGGQDVSGTDTVNVTMVGASTGAIDVRTLTTTNVETVNFTYDNQGSTATRSWLLRGSELLASPTTNRSSLQHVVLNAVGVTQTTINLGDTTGSDRLIVRSLTEPTTVNLRGGDDTVVLGDSLTGNETTIDAVQDPLTIDGGGDSGDLIEFDEAGRTASATINISGTQVSSSVSSTIAHSGFPTINFTGRNDLAATYSLTITDLGTIRSTVRLPGVGEDLVTLIGDHQALEIFGGIVDLLVFDWSQDSGSLTATLQDDPADLTGAVNNIVVGSTTDVMFRGFGLARINGSQFADTITVDTDVAIPVLIDGQAGNDRVRIIEIGARTDVIGGLGADQVDVIVPGSPGAPIHDELLDDLRVWVEQLVIDNRTSTTATKWKTDFGVVHYDDDGDPTDDFLPFLRVIGADEVKIIAGESSSGDTLVIEESIGTIDGTIGADGFQATGGISGVLNPASSGPDIVADFDLRALEDDGRFLYAVDGSGNARVFDRTTLTPLSSASGFGITASSKIWGGSIYNGRSLFLTTATGFVEFAVDGTGILSATPRQVTTASSPVDLGLVNGGVGLDEADLWVALEEELVLYQRLSNSDWSDVKSIPVPSAGDGRAIKAVEPNPIGNNEFTYIAVDIPGADNDLLYAITVPDFASSFTNPRSIGEGAVAFAQRNDLTYVTSEGSDRLDIYQFSVGQFVTSITVTVVGTFRDSDDGITGLEAPSAIASDGTYVYVASATEDTLAVFERDGSTGLIEFRQLLLDGATTAIGDARGLATVGANLIVAGGDGITAVPIAASPAALLRGVGFQFLDAITINTGDGDDVIDQTAAPLTGSLTLNTGPGADTLALAEFGPDYDLNAGGGNNVIGLSGTFGGALDVTTGSGSHTINVSGVASASSVVTLDVDGSNANVTLATSTGSAGQFNVDATGTSGQNTVRLSIGTDESTVTVNTGGGEDRFEVLALGANSTVIADLGDGDDSAFIDMPALDSTSLVIVDARTPSVDVPPSDALDPGAIGAVTLPDNTDGNPRSINDPNDPETVTIAGLGTLIYDGFEDIPGFVLTRATAESLTISEGAFRFQFNATVFPGSVDPNTTIVSRAWDLDGDGLFDDAIGEDPLLDF